MAEHLNVVFMGTPDFAAVILKHLLFRSQTTISAVITQPDRPKGRGRKLTPSPVKLLAQQNSLNLWQPSTLSGPKEKEYLTSLAPDFLLVAAYGHILPSEILAIPGYDSLNVHASLLPKYRGAAPIQRSLANGEAVTGISIMCMRPGLDCGPLLLQRPIPIGPQDTAATVHDNLAQLGGQCLVHTLDRWQAQDLVPVPQDEGMVTYAPKLDKNEGRINWHQPARRVHNHIRAMHPWPGAFTELQPSPGGKKIKLHIFPGHIGPEIKADRHPGTVVRDNNTSLRIACLDRYYLVHTVKPASKSPMSSSAFICGYLGSPADNQGPSPSASYAVCNP